MQHVYAFATSANEWPISKPPCYHNLRWCDVMFWLYKKAECHILAFPLLVHTQNCFIMEPLQLNCLSLYNKWTSLGTAVALLQAQGTFCREDSVNINGLLGCFPSDWEHIIIVLAAVVYHSQLQKCSSLNERWGIFLKMTVYMWLWNNRCWRAPSYGWCFGFPVLNNTERLAAVIFFFSSRNL